MHNKASFVNRLIGTIQGKFILVSLLSAAAVIVLVAESKLALTNARNHGAELLLISIVTQRHMEGDMMHDAIRSDVLGAIINAGKGDAQAVKQNAADLDEHYGTFKQNLIDNKKEPLPSEIRVLFDKALVALENYREAAAAAISEAGKGQAYDDPLARFEEKFELMEAENESISDEIETWATNTENQMQKVAADSENFTIILSVLAVVFVILVPIYARLKLFKPQAMMIGSMQKITKGDFAVAIAGADRNDEIGDMARSLVFFKQNGEERARLETERSEAALRAEHEKKNAMADLADRFETKVQGIIQSVASAATQLYQTSESMSGIVSNANRKASNVSRASSETSQNVQSVATATEEMSSSVKEIAEQILRSSGAVQSAVTEMERADHTSKLLGEATQRIGEIVELIQGIAGQINLLALNATIESARAGEAGKGFAVVASEVKQLATQTSKATEEIGGSIANIREVSDQVVHAMEAIKTAIDSVAEISSSISSAVEEQSAVTNEIASSMLKASTGTNQINNDIVEVSSATNEASASTEQTLAAAKVLSEQAEVLYREVDDFLAEVRAG